MGRVGWIRNGDGYVRKQIGTRTRTGTSKGFIVNSDPVPGSSPAPFDNLLSHSSNGGAVLIPASL